MKTTFFFRVALCLFIYLPIIGLGQCADCTADLNCTGIDGFPAVCPAIADTAYTNEYYEEFLTFYIPTQVTDPGSGIDATLLSVTVVTVTGLPYGLEFTLNDADGVFYPSQGENYGCATICGTPLIQGTYDVQIAVDIVAEAFGFEVNQSETFPYTIVVEPGEGGTGSFSYDNIAGCGTLDVMYEASLFAPLPSVTTYTWDFGNGNFSNEAAPSAVNYNTPGTYQCSLTTTIADYKLGQIAIDALSSNWSGDIDDVFSVSDTYFTLSDGQGNVIFTSDVIDNSETPSWADLNILLSNPPYTVTFYDEDDISADDDLGNTTLVLTDGNNPFDITSGTSGDLTVFLEETTSVTDSIEINVFQSPSSSFWVNGNVLYFDDPDLIAYQWFVNGTLLSNETASEITLTNGGEYTCLITNIYGCTSYSNSYLYCPDIQPTYDDLAQEVFVDQGYTSYQWFFNGDLIEGAVDYYYTTITPGNYSVLITTEYGCTTFSAVVSVTSDIAEKANKSAYVTPNPVQDIAVIHDLRPGSECKILDANGRQLQAIKATGKQQEIDLSGYSSGVYHLQMKFGGQVTHFKIVKL